MIFLAKYIEEVHRFKEVGMLPLALHQRHGYEATICCHKDPRAPVADSWDGVKLENIKTARWPCRFLSSIGENRHMLLWLARNARAVDVLVLLYFTRAYVIFAWLYRLLNPLGVIYLKADLTAGGLETILGKRRYIKNLRDMFHLSDLISVPTTSVYEYLRESAGRLGVSTEMTHCYPNGFDDSREFERITFEKKRKTINTVGRLGAHPKNTEMLLRALERVELGDWEVLFVGPCETTFKQAFDEHLSRNPRHACRLRLLGPIDDRDALYRQYDEARIFCLTSTFESFGFVLDEALYFDDYIITTDVGAARDIVIEGLNGNVVAVDDEVAIM